MGLDKKAEWQALYVEQRKALIDYATPLTKSRDEAEDVVQEAFLHFMPKEPDQPAPPKAYLFRIVRNLTFNRKRHQKVRASQAVEDLPWWARSLAIDTPEEQVLFCEHVRIAAQVIEDLPQQMRQIAELYRIEGLTLEEISARLNLSKSTVHRLLKEAMKTIREQIALRR